jgi:mono/diheme cytochrome c family protein
MLHVDRSMVLAVGRGHRLRLAAILAAAVLLGVAAAQGPDGGELGATTYAQCAACHQATGAGIPGAFPPLVGHAPAVFAADGGRAYLATLVLYGLLGPIEVDGAAYNGMMTPFAHLDDAALAAVLNHVLHAWGNDALLPAEFAPFTPEDIAAQRGLGLAPADVAALRATLDLE